MAARLSGWTRLKIVLSGLWILAIVLIACSQYFLAKSPARAWFVYDARYDGTQWFPADEPTPSPTDAETPISYATKLTTIEPTRLIRYERAALVGLGPVVAFWVLGFAATASFRWINSGFEGDAKAASQKNKQAPV